MQDPAETLLLKLATAVIAAIPTKKVRSQFECMTHASLLRSFGSLAMFAAIRLAHRESAQAFTDWYQPWSSAANFAIDPQLKCSSSTRIGCTIYGSCCRRCRYPTAALAGDSSPRAASDNSARRALIKHPRVYLAAAGAD